MLVSRFGKFVAKMRMGDGNQHFSPLAMALSRQARHPVLRHDRIGVKLWYRDERRPFAVIHRLVPLTVAE